MEALLETFGTRRYTYMCQHILVQLGDYGGEEGLNMGRLRLFSMRRRYNRGYKGKRNKKSLLGAEGEKRKEKQCKYGYFSFCWKGGASCLAASLFATLPVFFSFRIPIDSAACLPI